MSLVDVLRGAWLTLHVVWGVVPVDRYMMVDRLEWTAGGWSVTTGYLPIPPSTVEYRRLQATPAGVTRLLRSPAIQPSSPRPLHPWRTPPAWCSVGYSPRIIQPISPSNLPPPAWRIVG